MNATDECIDVCNSLLRGELSAVETYQQAMEKFKDQPEFSTLQQIRADHEDSVAALRTHLTEMGAEAATDSGAWGGFAKAVEGSAKLLGESPALAALSAGEEHGINEYKSALENPDVMQDIKGVIRTRLLPSLDRHVTVLEGLRNRR